MKLGDAIDKIFSYNEVVAIWRKDNDRRDIREWYGVAYRLPYWYKDVENWKIFGVIPDSIDYADTINIRIEA